MSSRSLTKSTGKHLHSGHRDAGREVGLTAVHGFLRGVAESFRRARQRRDLAHLSEHGLRDIGLTRYDVDLELKKPFWRP